MKKFTIWQLVVALVFISNISFSQIISQYVETSSGTTPKGIEIWNNTAGVLDFAANNLVVKKGANGNAPAVDYTLAAGTLAVGEVIVIGTSDMGATTTGNGSVFFLKGFQFNGDDALEIWYGATKTDVFGMPSNDPGTSWDGNGVSTKNQNIKISNGITSGSLTGWTDPSTRFETVCTTNCLTDFGIAPILGGGGTVDTPTFAPPAGFYTSAQNVVIASTTVGATIYYSTDGSVPSNVSATSTLYAGPVNAASATVIKAIAYKAPLTESAVATAAYVFPITVGDIATLRTKPVGADLYILTGEAVLTFQQAYRNQKYIEDATGAILIDDNPGNITTVYNPGDGITNIIGSIGQYKGMLQFIPVADPGAATSVGNPLVPTVVTAAAFVANFEDYEAMLVRVNGLTFDDAGANFATGQVYNTVDGGANNLEFRTSFYKANYVDPPTAIPAGVQDIIGIANDRDDPFLTARFSADIIAAGAPPAVPLGSTGIMIAGILLAGIIVVRKGKLF